jgi:hypothetical protein
MAVKHPAKGSGAPLTISKGGEPGRSQAAHVIDGLPYHEAQLTSAVHHTAGGGLSDHVSCLPMW